MAPTPLHSVCRLVWIRVAAKRYLYPAAYLPPSQPGRTIIWAVLTTAWDLPPSLKFQSTNPAITNLHIARLMRSHESAAEERWYQVSARTRGGLTPSRPPFELPRPL